MHGHRTVELIVAELHNQLSAQLLTEASSLVTNTINEARNTEPWWNSRRLTTDLRKRCHQHTTVKPWVKIIRKRAARGVISVESTQTTVHIERNAMGIWGRGGQRKESSQPTDNPMKPAYCYLQPSSTQAIGSLLPRNQLLQAWAVTGRYAAVQLWWSCALCWTPCNSFTRSALLHESHS